MSTWGTCCVAAAAASPAAATSPFTASLTSFPPNFPTFLSYLGSSSGWLVSCASPGSHLPSCSDFSARCGNDDNGGWERKKKKGKKSSCPGERSSRRVLRVAGVWRHRPRSQRGAQTLMGLLEAQRRGGDVSSRGWPWGQALAPKLHLPYEIQDLSRETKKTGWQVFLGFVFSITLKAVLFLPCNKL